VRLDIVYLQKQLVQDYTYGLGGRDIGLEEIEKVFKELLKGQISDQIKYVGLRKQSNK